MLRIIVLLGILLCSLLAAQEAELLTLDDGRVFTGIYDEEQHTITLTGGMTAVIRIKPGQVVKREPAAAASDGSSTTTTVPGGFRLVNEVDPAVIAPIAASEVPWESGDRLLLIGDLLAAPSQPELALRLHEALAPRGVSVFSMMNHALPLERVAAAAREEIRRRPPQIVVIMAGVGDIVHALPPVKAGAANEPPPALNVPTAAAWHATLATVATAARDVGAVVVIATPAIVGDKPTGGPGESDLNAWATEVRAVADASGALVCDLRTPLLNRLTERNPRSTRESGILSREPGQLRPEGMDIVARAVVASVIEAVSRIPWQVRLSDTTFQERTQVDLRTARLANDLVDVHYTLDGSEPTAASPRATAPILLTQTALLRVAAITKADRTRRTAQAWFVAATPLDPERAPPDSLPGLWVDHYDLSDWGTGRPPFDAESTVRTWWPNIEAAPFTALPPAQRPARVQCAHYHGWFLAPRAGTYVFALRSGGRARLLLNDHVVVDLAPDQRQQRGGVALEHGWYRLSCLRGDGADEVPLTVQVGIDGQRLRAIPDLLLRRDPTPPGAEVAIIDTVNGAADPAAPWSIRLDSSAMTESLRVEPRLVNITPEQVVIHVTTDGSEPTVESPLYSAPILVSRTTRIRMLAIAGDRRVTADAWYCSARASRAADAMPTALAPGLWVEHCSLRRWTDPISSIETLRADFVGTWPNAELDAFTQVPVHRYPNEMFGLRFSGYFYAPVDGTYVFHTNSDDATRVVLPPVTVLRNDDLHPARWEAGAVQLTTGYHPLFLPYGQGPGVIVLDVYVHLDGQRRQRLGDLLLARPLEAPLSRTGAISEE